MRMRLWIQYYLNWPPRTKNTYQRSEFKLISEQIYLAPAKDIECDKRGVIKWWINWYSEESILLINPATATTMLARIEIFQFSSCFVVNYSALMKLLLHSSKKQTARDISYYLLCSIITYIWRNKEYCCIRIKLVENPNNVGKEEL